MTTDRFNLGPLLIAHWKCLSYETSDGVTKGDWPARLGLLVPALAAGIALPAFHGSLSNVGSLLAADALLASSLLAVFAQISTLRVKYSDRYQGGLPLTDTDKDAMDESATHLLFAVMLAFVNASVLVVALAWSSDGGSRITGPLAGISTALFVYMALLLLMLLPRLLHAYTTVNDVRDDLSGFHRK
jgi:hypothetical protein